MSGMSKPDLTRLCGVEARRMFAEKWVIANLSQEA